MKKYEVTYLTVAEENHNAGTVADILAQNDAKIVSVNLWSGRRKLAYPIKKQDQAFYTTVIFEAEPSAIQPIEKALSLKDDVLRSLVVIYAPGYFERMAAGEDVTAPAREEAKSAQVEDADQQGGGSEQPVKTGSRGTSTVVEAPAEEVTEAPSEVTETTEEAATEEVSEEKPKRTRAKKAEPTDEKVLDEKIDELLNEDITK